MAGWLLPFLAGLSLSGCQVAHMALPQELRSETSELTVEGRPLLIATRSFRFGPYRVTDVHRGWTRGEGLRASTGASELGSSRARQEYEFLLHEPDRPTWTVQCASTSDWSRWDTEGFLGGRFGVELSSDQQLVCALKQDRGQEVARLVMSMSASANETALHGVMMHGEARIDISGTHALATTPIPLGTPTGYVFNVGGRPVGAVEVINSGMVWLDDSLTPETRSALAAASAALLLYQEIEED